ncbi:hypothetical protein HAX54_021839 [Datura stramonium]|uniref:Uncharacterized protein n=1 Tax=Datura stramonium TaxID=4076 RepID=A0ABS8S717_DATST|nr:hypothetical protein [Datura stramonium]
MADKDTKVTIIDQIKNPEEEGSGAYGELLKLRQQLIEWNRAWPVVVDTTPVHSPGYNHITTMLSSNFHFPAPQYRTTVHPMALTLQAFIASPLPEAPTSVVRLIIIFSQYVSERVLNVSDVQHCASEPKFKLIRPYCYTQQSDFSFDTDNKKKAWSLTKPVPPIYKSFVKIGANKSVMSSVPKSVIDTKLVGHFQNLFMRPIWLKFGKVPVTQICNSLILMSSSTIGKSLFSPTRKEF